MQVHRLTILKLKNVPVLFNTRVAVWDLKYIFFIHKQSQTICYSSIDQKKKKKRDQIIQR